jgi:putative salt-induced outer membrane protein YdiY
LLTLEPDRARFVRTASGACTGWRVVEANTTAESIKPNLEVNMRLKMVVCSVILFSVIVFVSSPAVWAQDEENKYRWYLTTELSSVVTTGNSESNTFGLVATLRRLYERAELKFDGGAVRTESALKTRTAVGTKTDFRVDEEKRSEKTAENYYARGRCDYNITKRFDVFGGVDWLRNPFAGLDSRFLLALGAGNIWADSEKRRFKTNYSMTYTFEEEVVENPFTSSRFGGVRLGYDYFDQLTESTQFTSVLTADWNLDNTEDVRVNVNFGLPISITKKLAFKPLLTLQWRNDPAVTEVPLFDTSGTDTGETVLVPLEELDMIFTAALVVSL